MAKCIICDRSEEVLKISGIEFYPYVIFDGEICCEEHIHPDYNTFLDKITEVVFELEDLDQGYYDLTGETIAIW